MSARERQVAIDDPDLLLRLSGASGEILRELSGALEVSLGMRGDTIFIRAESEEGARAAEAALVGLAEILGSRQLDRADILRAARTVIARPELKIRDLFEDAILKTPNKRLIAPKGLAQQRYVDAFRNHDIVFGIGPAGTGKTYLAVAQAVSAFLERKVERIVLTRPAVEAGEKLGFLPGNLAEKVNPYLRPLYDALHEMMDVGRVAMLMERGTIEVAPLAFMRGRTLNDAFVILDEAQNTTPAQMKMFLTRLGFRSKTAITGDITQVDLPRGTRSGLRDAEHLLQGIEGIAFCRFSGEDVVRHPLVQKIISRYEEREARHLARRLAAEDLASEEE